MDIIRKEFKWLVGFSVVVLIITTAPYYIAHRHINSFRFTGFVFGAEDGNSYIAKMLSGANGAWLFKTPYTAHDQKGFIAFIPYMVLGKLTSPPAQHSQMLYLFHLFRWIGVTALIIITYLFISNFIQNTFLRRVTTIVATVGGGFGWLSIFGISEIFKIDLALEFYSPETFGFLSVLGLPHLAAARAFLLLSLLFYLKQPQSWHQRIAAGISLFIVGVFQPLTIVTAWILLGTHLCLILFYDVVVHGKRVHSFLLVRKNRLATAVVMVMFSSPWVIYNLLSFTFDPYLSGWVSQNIISSPPIRVYIFSFALLLPCVLVGLHRILIISKDPHQFLPAAIILIFPFLAYAPYNLQRRLPEGIWLGLTIVGFLIFDHVSDEKKRLIPKILMGISLISPLIILVGTIQVVRDPQLPLFRSEQEIAAFKFIATETPKESLVISSYETGNALPAWAPVHVLVGHGPESVNLDQTLQKIENLYSGLLSEPDIISLIGHFKASYVFYGPYEQQIGNLQPESYYFLDLIYEDPPYFIYQISLSDISDQNK